MSKTEILRRLRLSDHYKYLWGRYPEGLPDADDGHEDLCELLLTISLAAGCYRKINGHQNWAGWMSEDEAEQLVDSINRTPNYQRKRTARQNGEICDLTVRNASRGESGRSPPATSAKRSCSDAARTGKTSST